MHSASSDAGSLLIIVLVTQRSAGTHSAQEQACAVPERVSRSLRVRRLMHSLVHDEYVTKEIARMHEHEPRVFPAENPTPRHRWGGWRVAFVVVHTRSGSNVLYHMTSRLK